jgi:competence protein ComGC
MLLFLSQCIGNMSSLVEGKTDESEFIFYLGILLCFLLISIVVIIMIPSVIVLTNDIVEGRRNSRMDTNYSRRYQ